MGKSRTSPLSKTSSGIGIGGGMVGGSGGGAGISAEGGAGGASASTTTQVGTTASASASTVQQMQQTIANNVNAPTVQALGNNIDVSAFKQMSDDQLAQIITQSQGVDLPNQLNDVNNEMQKFTYYAGLNTKPMVLDDASFNQYMKDNGISKSEIIARDVNSASYKLPSGASVPLSARQIADMYMYSDSHYVGGKKGGSLHGYGGYFAVTGGSSTGYGGRNSVTIQAVFSQNAKSINESSIQSRWSSFANAHPKADRAMRSIRDTDSRQNMQAILMGYNVVRCSNSYRVVLDRSALVFHQ